MVIVWLGLKYIRNKSILFLVFMVRFLVFCVMVNAFFKVLVIFEYFCDVLIVLLVNLMFVSSFFSLLVCLCSFFEWFCVIFIDGVSLFMVWERLVIFLEIWLMRLFKRGKFLLKVYRISF